MTTQHRGKQRLSFPPAPALIVRGQSIDDVKWRFSLTAWKDVPGLERIFVDEYEDNPAKFRRLQRALPDIHVWHLDLNVGRIASVVFLLLATMILGGAVLQQMQSTFALPQARMNPRFAWPHLLVPLAICVAGIVAATFIGGKFGADYWATASLQVFGWGVWAAFEFLAPFLRPDRSPASRGLQGRALDAISQARTGWIGPVILIVLVTVLGSTFIGHPYVLESFLLGELPALTAGFFVVGVGSGIAAVKGAPQTAVSSNEIGVMPILSMPDVESRRRAPLLSAPRTGWRLDSLRRPHRIAWLWRIRAMRLGNPDVLVPIAVKIAVPAFLAAAGACIVNLWYLSATFGLLLIGAGWLLSISSCFANWWQRRKAFSVELLYPWTRRQLALAVVAAYAIDTAGVWVVLFTTVVACDLTLGWGLDPRVILRGAAVAAAAAALVVVGGLWLLTLRHRLLASFLAFVGLVLMYRSFTLAEWALRNGVGLGYVVVLYVALLILYGVAAYQRWMRAEWGTLGP